MSGDKKEKKTYDRSPNKNEMQMSPTPLLHNKIIQLLGEFD